MAQPHAQVADDAVGNESGHEGESLEVQGMAPAHPCARFMMFHSPHMYFLLSTAIQNDCILKKINNKNKNKNNT